MTSFILVLTWLSFITINQCIEIPKSCPDIKFGSIPSNHLFHTKEKPLIIGHRGQPMKFQENTLDGIRSVVGIKADGYELDIYKTKDDKLVVFHDDNTLRMTGVSKVIWESTYEELQALNLKTEIKAGGKTYKYDKPRKIPLLEDVLKVTKDTNLLHYLEMKPSEPKPNDEELTEKTGKMVAHLVTKMGLSQRAILVSFDYRKVYRVKTENSNLTVGTLFTSSYSQVPKPTQQLIDTFPKYRQCFLDAPSDSMGFFEFSLNTGLVFKLSGSSSFDSNLGLYNNKRFSNDTVAMMRKNYSPDISTGFYTMYSMSNLELKNKAAEKKLIELLKQGGGERVITDNVPRSRKFLKKNKFRF